ncbi:OsmC family protein [Luteimonas sp. Sa2BVA3]|uniref:OsmC family protein n=1 Tax=Luteimonas colneyensis TaxID=2762230 RepID=A0ABR8UHH4_9GAMM|nr:OsmC family protein [Luteimonas colneyensis]MBD7987458.1 OsmC family protein [Luteimonas colneyensis]
MEISAHIRSGLDVHELIVSTDGASRPLVISARPSGRGSAVNGGELLMAALATCYCNDLYREASRLGVPIAGCKVRVQGHFNGVGLAAQSVTYSAVVESSAPAVEVEALLSETDRLAEIHNTLRRGCAVERVAWHGPAA